jgi:hypothetical protein
MNSHDNNNDNNDNNPHQGRIPATLEAALLASNWG